MTTGPESGPGEERRIFCDPAAYADPDSWHAAAALLRRADPVAAVSEAGFPPFHAVTRYADVVEIERQHDKFLNTLSSVLIETDVFERQMAEGMLLKTLVHMDGTEHRGYRKLTNDWFKPANLRRVFESRIAELARQFVDRMADLGGECDFARDVALLYPLHVIMSILGVPESDEPRMLRLTQQLFGAEDPEFGGYDRGEAMMAAALEFHEYFNGITDSRRKNPVEDIATILANGEIDGKPLGDVERTSYYVIIATAGHDTTSSSLTGGLEALIRRPDQLEALQNDPSLIPNAVDEIIRWVTPVRHFMRHATEDYVLSGTSIRAGDRLLMSYLSANRDEEIFDDPMTFDVRRANASEHLAFGVGVHFCLGAHLARMELRAFLAELLPRLERIESAGEPQYVSSTFVGGIKSLPIRYALRPGRPA